MRPRTRLLGRSALLLLLAGVACDGSLAGLSGGVTSRGAGARRQVVFLSAAPEAALPAEEAAAWAWLQTREDFVPRHLQFLDLPAARLPRDAILWWHYAEEAALPSIALRRASLEAVREHLRAGGNLLLSLIAASWVVPLEIEATPPDVVARRAPFAVSGAEVNGFQSRGHPLLSRFRGSVLPAANPAHAEAAAAAYTGDRWPQGGHVWAVHKSERGSDRSIKVGVEYTDVYGAGSTVLTLGAHSYFADAGNRNRSQLEQLFGDALRYLDRQAPAPPPGAALAGDGEVTLAAAGDARYFRPAMPVFARSEVPPGELPPEASAAAALSLLERAGSGLEVRRYDDRAGFTVTAPRALLRGSQLGRVEELRVHPRGLLRDLRLGLVRPGRGVTWLDEGAGARTFIARPEGAELRYNDGEVEVGVRLTIDRRYPALVAAITVRSPGAVEVVATWRAHLEAAGGGPVEGAGTPRIGWDEGAQAFVWGDDGVAVKAGFGRATPAHVLGFSAEAHLRDGGLVIAPAPAPAETEAGTAAATEVAGDAAAVPTPPAADPARVALQVRLDPPAGRPALLPLVVVGGPIGEVDVDRAFAELVAAPARPWADNAAYFRDFLHLGHLGGRTTALLAPDRAFEDAFKWAKVGIEALRATSAGTGSGLLAGIGSGTEWSASTNAFGGSEPLWAAMAADAYGDRAPAADTLRLMARFQDVDGRIPEVVAGPLDSLESSLAPTALFLIALDNHVRTWGDRALLEALWPSAQRAADYLGAADLSGDGLVDAVSRRDRWSRDRAVQTPIDLAGLAAAAWESLARLARAMGDTARATQAEAAATTIRPLLNERFWDANERRFNFAKRNDGSFVPVGTVLPAVPLIFDLLDAGRAGVALDAFSGQAFSRDWGVGLLAATPPAPAAAPAATPAPAPSGLPAPGADVVSPVFTGWTALAAYRNQRPEAGFVHTMTNLLLLPHGNPGYADAAFDGAGFAPRPGVEHDAAAAAMTVLPVVWGTLGIRPDALDRVVRIAPQLPAGWNRINVDRVRVGDSAFRLQVRRSPTQIQFRVDLWSGPRDLVLQFTAHVPADVAIGPDPALTGFELVGDGSAAAGAGPAGARVTTVSVRPTAETSVLSFNHDPYPRLIPTAQLVARHQEASGGLRTIRTRYLSGLLGIQAEGLPGQTYALTVATPWRVRQVTGVPGVRWSQEEGLATLSVTVPGSGNRYRPIDLEVTFER